MRSADSGLGVYGFFIYVSYVATEDCVHTVLETEAFDKSAKEAGLSEAERHEIVLFLADNPQAGEVIPGAGGARKVRFPLRNKGKSGGVRVVTFYSGEDVPVFLLEVFKKGDRINLSQKERNELKQVLADLAEDYRQSVKEKTERIGRAS